ncbi:MAG: hypothetical protein AVO33_00860 [delta proteobacterium ML8_F1]|nr:MAG: hypothetical protein AVO33_00860 [delta proteobacterium ML8_F1]
MKYYYKVIGLTGHYYAHEFKKIKSHKNKIRELREETVIRNFQEGVAGVKVIFEETDQSYTLDSFSDPDLIRKYLGKDFL